ncbi:MAG: general secretion pathway protein GspF [Gammaproteobacteria bacterium]|nr:general secretion pathway protein GspF [Gammaproteobacteria bacterium]
MKRPKTAEAYIDLLKQAVFEVEELQASFEFDAEGMGGVTDFIDELTRQVKAVYQSMQAGTYEFKDQDLPFMATVRRNDGVFLPFRDLLNLINDTHRNGLEVDG